MNKLLKGSIAGAAGIALLLGGAGTFALWNQTATVANGSVTSGVLTIAPGATGTWKDISAGKTASTISNIGAFRMVPGDKLELTQQVTIKATGDNLAAKLTYDPASITTAVLPSNTANDAATALNVALKNKLAVTFTASGTGVSSAGNEATIAPSATETVVTVVMTIELPLATGDPITPVNPSSNPGTIAQTGTVGLANLSFKLNQTRTV